MKIIRFQSLHGQQVVDCPDLGEYRRWENGQEKQVPDDVAEMALSNPNFVEVTDDADVEEDFTHSVVGE